MKKECLDFLSNVYGIFSFESVNFFLEKYFNELLNVNNVLIEFNYKDFYSLSNKDQNLIIKNFNVQIQIPYLELKSLSKSFLKNLKNDDILIRINDFKKYVFVDKKIKNKCYLISDENINSNIEIVNRKKQFKNSSIRKCSCFLIKITNTDISADCFENCQCSAKNYHSYFTIDRLVKLFTMRDYFHENCNGDFFKK